jgi:hypothetical protein
VARKTQPSTKAKRPTKAKTQPRVTVGSHARAAAHQPKLSGNRKRK